MGVHIVEDVFAEAVNPLTNQIETIRRFTLANDQSMSVQVISHGATITSLKVPDVNGSIGDIVLGYDEIAGYKTSRNPYFGATVGRVCNRIANGRFTLNEQQIEVSRNLNDKHHLHGGYIGFDKVHWSVVDIRDNGVSMRHQSPDGHEGYPGVVTATVHFTLTEDNCFHVRMEAETTKTTVVNMTNHSYFNLAGHEAGKDALYAHHIKIKADQITETNADIIPTGRLTAVQNTPYDLRAMCNLGERLNAILPDNGFDHNYCVNLENNGAITTIARVCYPGNGRWLEIASNQPGVQFYTSNAMPNVDKGETPIVGKSNAQYVKQCAFCLETQKYPDAVHHPNFPSIVLNPGEKYNHEVIYKFGVSHGSGLKN